MHDRDAGFSLTEALIATSLSLVVILSALSALTQANSLSDTSRIISETNQNLQAAMSLMVRDFIQTGTGIPNGGIPIPSGAGATPVIRPGPAGPPLQFPAGWTTMPALSPGADLGPTLLGVQTDMVTLLYVDATIALNEFPLTAVDGAANTITVDNQTDLTGPDGLRAGDLVLLSNPLGFALRMVTVTPAAQTVSLAPGDPLNLNQTAAAQGTLANLSTGPNVFPPTTANRVTLVTYYLDTATDPQLPRLVRQVNSGPRLAIALGIENFQVTFDLVDGTNNPANVPAPPVGNSPNQIRKVNLFLSARSLERNRNTNQFFRNSMATQVSLRSLSFVDRYQ
jgi:hypothetical protein